MAVKIKKILFADQQITPSDAIFDTLDGVYQALVVLHKSKRLFEALLYDRRANKNIGRLIRINRPIGNRPLGYDNQPEETHLFIGHHFIAIFVPVRLKIGPPA